MLEKHCAFSLKVRGFYPDGYTASQVTRCGSGECARQAKLLHGYSILLSVVSISTAALFGGSPDGENAFSGSNKTKYFRLRLCYEVS